MNVESNDLLNPILAKKIIIATISVLSLLFVIHPFIDGTVEGNPADLTVYIDDDIDHDHTYFGNGCPNGWGTDGDGGSTTPCSTRIVQSSDDENQKNGTYYTFQAASSGSGATIATQNTIIPDTFCPLGWQLPYGGTGGDYYDQSKSWHYLLSTYNIQFNDGSIDDVYKLKSFPLSYINSGILNWNNGRLYYLSKISSGTGLYWSSTTWSNDKAFRLSSWTVAVRTGGTSGKYEGDALRCVNNFSIPSSTARWKERIFILEYLGTMFT